MDFEVNFLNLKEDQKIKLLFKRVVKISSEGSSGTEGPQHKVICVLNKTYKVEFGQLQQLLKVHAWAVLITPKKVPKVEPEEVLEGFPTSKMRKLIYCRFLFHESVDFEVRRNMRLSSTKRRTILVEVMTFT